jgi:hypothetical protein
MRSIIEPSPKIREPIGAVVGTRFSISIGLPSTDCGGIIVPSESYIPAETSLSKDTYPGGFIRRPFVASITLPFPKISEPGGGVITGGSPPFCIFKPPVGSCRACLPM